MEDNKEYKSRHEKRRDRFKERKPVSKVLIVLLQLVFAIVIFFAAMILFLSLTEYKPDDVEKVAITGRANSELSVGDKFSVMSWNIGYGALGDNADFFMDGGSSVMTADEDRVNENMDAVISGIKTLDPDVVMVQETDRSSSRSYSLNEYELLQSKMSYYNSSFANNFKVAFLPYPIPPIGKVDSGIATFSKYQLASAERIQLPIPFKWPVRMVNLKRCLLVSRTPIKGSDKELVLVNLHLEAYDSGAGKVAQTKMLADILNEEYKKGNYVIAGGDFNQIFSDKNQDAFRVKEGMWKPGVIDVKAIGDNWQYLMDESVPSCRSLDQPYEGADHSDFQYYLIDGFIVSDNIDVSSFRNQDLDFKNSDHNPVYMEVTLK